MSNAFLTSQDVAKLTGKCRYSAQRRILQERGLPHDVNSRGEILVLWSVVEARMGLKRPEEAEPEPRWEALYGKEKTS